jgi:hypothetical protein
VVDVDKKGDARTGRGSVRAEKEEEGDVAGVLPKRDRITERAIAQEEEV